MTLVIHVIKVSRVTQVKKPVRLDRIGTELNAKLFPILVYTFQSIVLAITYNAMSGKSDPIMVTHDERRHRHSNYVSTWNPP